LVLDERATVAGELDLPALHLGNRAGGNEGNGRGVPCGASEGVVGAIEGDAFGFVVGAVEGCADPEGDRSGHAGGNGHLDWKAGSGCGFVHGFGIDRMARKSPDCESGVSRNYTEVHSAKLSG